MDFVFADDKEFDPSSLRQGDLIIRDAAVRAVLQQAHQYYAEAESYSHFVVVTQSCDLVRRGSKPPKANYITLAAVRPFQLVIDRFLKSCSFQHDGREFGVYDSGKRILAEQFLERILNNEEKGFFFFRSGSHPSVTEDQCAFLALSVALRSSHYDALLQAKVAQLEDIFSAKLGWLVGTMHSRIATPDISEKIGDAAAYKREFFQEKLDDERIWISSTRWKALVKEMRRERLLEEPNVDGAKAILTRVPDDMDFLARRVAEVLYNEGLIERTAEKRAEVEARLRNDQNLRSIARALTA